MFGSITFEDFQSDEIITKKILSLDNFVLEDFVLFDLYFYLSLCLQRAGLIKKICSGISTKLDKLTCY